MTRFLLPLFLLTSVLGTAPAAAQSALSAHVLSGGGVDVADGSFRLQGTVGEPVVGTFAGADRTARAGFWFASSAVVSTPVERIPAAPGDYALQGNHPNPVSERTVVRYALPEAAPVQLTVYDVLGREVATLVDRKQAAGRYEASFEAAKLPGGVYVYRLRAGDFTETRRMVVVE